MKNRPVVFLDSGVGGLTYLSEARKILPGESFVYVADNENFPYGGKSVKELKEIVLSVIENITRRFNPKTVVIACNTASVVTLESLRKRFGIPFVGVVPAVKPAAEYTRNGRIGLLATESTVRSIYTDDLIREFASNCRVVRFAGVSIVDFVENSYYTADKEDVIKNLLPAADFFLKKDVDSIILGCTHFLFVRKPLQKLLGPEIRIIDSVEGVVKQLKRVLPEYSSSEDGSSRSVFYITGNRYRKSRYGKFAEDFGLEWGGDI